METAQQYLAQLGIVDVQMDVVEHPAHKGPMSEQWKHRYCTVQCLDFGGCPSARMHDSRLVAVQKIVC